MADELADSHENCRYSFWSYFGTKYSHEVIACDMTVLICETLIDWRLTHQRRPFKCGVLCYFYSSAQHNAMHSRCIRNSDLCSYRVH